MILVIRMKLSANALPLSKINKKKEPSFGFLLEYPFVCYISMAAFAILSLYSYFR